MLDTILIIEDEHLLGNELSRYFQRQNWEVKLVRNIEDAKDLLFENKIEPLIILSDLNLPDGNGLDFLEFCRNNNNASEWIFLTAFGSVPDSVRAVRLGAYEFLEKPCELERLNLAVSGARRTAHAQRRLQDVNDAEIRKYSVDNYVGSSAEAQKVREMLQKLSSVPFSALIISGETGTGKGLAARILHRCSDRAEGPMIEVNCAALPHDLLESELFGHEAGAFTGAKSQRRGLFEQAHNGTLFLDEIGELNLELQSKLLTAIEDRRIRRLGAEREMEIDVQVIVASNRDLPARVKSGDFRSDLYHRLSVFQLHLPTLNERKEDLKELVPALINEYNAKAHKNVQKISPAVWQKLQDHNWPGNVRELRNVIERCVLFANGEDFPEQWLQLGSAPQGDQTAHSSAQESDGNRIAIPIDGSMALDDMDKFIIKTTLERCKYNVTAAARLLKTTRETLRYRIQKYNLVSKNE
ncbi:MAG: sigma-54 dependent transcriptional regulator [Gammaproteobacteria bacterium]|nr:sigma-54 dependent transcriptional regulator [Gammaproteobacteria bacterium]